MIVLGRVFAIFKSDVTFVFFEVLWQPFGGDTGYQLIKDPFGSFLCDSTQCASGQLDDSWWFTYVYILPWKASHISETI